MKILLTGINGFVGGHLAQRLITNPINQVWGIARGTQLALPELNGHVQLVSMDLRDQSALRATMAAIAPDAIIHLAAQASVAKSFGDAVNTMHDNVLPSVALMQYAVELKLDPLIIIAGSNEIYGNVPAITCPSTKTNHSALSRPTASVKLPPIWRRTSGLCRTRYVLFAYGCLVISAPAKATLMPYRPLLPKLPASRPVAKRPSSRWGIYRPARYKRRARCGRCLRGIVDPW
jgi:GDP-D-mannose dehydratase